MDQYGDVVLEDGARRPEIAAVLSRSIDSVLGIYAAGTEDLIGVQLAAGSKHLVIACWGDELTINSVLADGLRNRTATE